MNIHNNKKRHGTQSLVFLLHCANECLSHGYMKPNVRIRLIFTLSNSIHVGDEIAMVINEMKNSQNYMINLPRMTKKLARLAMSAMDRGDSNEG